MCFDDQVVGVIVFKVFEQNQHFVAVDLKLFKILSAHGTDGCGSAFVVCGRRTAAGARAFAHLTK